jgi:dTDP-4-amino-4,6-dideoxygalactose transaminase
MVWLSARRWEETLYTIGNEEISAIARVIESRKMFRYGIGEECSRFETRYAKRLGVAHCLQTSSGTSALTAALIGAGIGPGDEVVVPACTFMATPISVLAVGAIPIIVDIDESITMDPKALESFIGPRTRAVIPVHMWGLPCAMGEIMDIARRHNLIVVEDACQGIGGAFEGKALGSIGDVGVFSFNYYKNMTCGEGGAVTTNNPDIARKADCAIDPCRFYWDGRDDGFTGFVANGSRASEIEGAMLNVQLDRLDGMISAMQSQKKRILAETATLGLRFAPSRSPQWECGTHVMYQFDDGEAADRFAEGTGGTVTLKTGRHVYTEWDPILAHRGGPHPALNPYEMDENRECRKDYSPEMCRSSLDILGRTVFVQTDPEFSDDDVGRLVERIAKASTVVGAAGR